jgi:thiamine-monophosphate kinase
VADVSDGLLGDLGHILDSSGVGASIDTSIAMTLLAARAYYSGATSQFESEIGNPLALQAVLSGGDDYELVFTAPVSRRAQVQAAAQKSNTPVTRIGCINSTAGLRLMDSQGASVENRFTSFDHFA